MIKYRPWKLSTSTSSLPTRTSSSSSNGNNITSLASVRDDNRSISSSIRRSSFVSDCRLAIIILLIGGISILFLLLLVWERPEDYIAKMDPRDRNKVAICAIQKGGLNYLEEWTKYHLLAIGFDTIYLYDNSDDFELQAWHNHNNAYDDDNYLKERIHITHFPGASQQFQAYTHCGKRIQKAHSHGWIAFLDIDEFVVLRSNSSSSQSYHNISDLLKSLPANYGGLAMNWIQIKLNHQRQYRPLPVTLRFQNRSETATNRHIKTIARSAYFRRMTSAHFVNYYRWWRIHTYDTNGHPITGPFNPAHPVDRIALYHYQTKSLEEYKERCARGRVSVPKKDWGLEVACQSDEEILKRHGSPEELIKDDAPWQLLKERVPDYANKYISI